MPISRRISRKFRALIRSALSFTGILVANQPTVDAHLAKS